MIKAVLFDLDGTLLQMDIDYYNDCYFKALHKKLVSIGYPKDKIISGMWSAINAMLKNDGSVLNEKIFWKEFSNQFGQRVYDDEPVFDDFYKNEFVKIGDNAGEQNPMAAEIVRWLKSQGIITVLATNAVYPKIAAHERLRWTGLFPEDFSYITTYDNSYACKPNLKYYEQILSAIDCKPEETLMVGNDVQEDMIAGKIGMNVFLLVEFMINRDNSDISIYPHGSFDELKKYIENLL